MKLVTTLILIASSLVVQPLAPPQGFVEHVAGVEGIEIHKGPAKILCAWLEGGDARIEVYTGKKVLKTIPVPKWGGVFEFSEPLRAEKDWPETVGVRCITKGQAADPGRTTLAVAEGSFASTITSLFERRDEGLYATVSGGDYQPRNVAWRVEKNPTVIHGDASAKIHYDVPERGDVTFRIGNKVAGQTSSHWTKSLGDHPKGWSKVYAWNLKDDKGALFKPGIYPAKYSVVSRESSSRLTVCGDIHLKGR